MKYSAFLTTAPRSTPVLRVALGSLANAGICPVVCSDFSGNAFCHWLATAKAAVASQDDAEGVLICQDDILVASGLGRALEALWWPSYSIGAVSLYCPSRYSGQFGWVRHEGSFSWGACCLLFPREILSRLINSPFADHWKSDRGIDRFVGKGLELLGLDLRYHCPSLVQHIGEVSTLGDDPAAGWRAASDFVGEDFENIIWPEA